LWRVCPYVFGLGAADYAQAQAVAQAVFGGERSYPEPLRVVDAYAHRALIAQLGRPRESDNGGPQPYQYATPLPSAELATLAHLPLEEMPGYHVRDYARFDVDPPPAAGPRRLALGDVLDYDRPTGNAYTVNLDRLTQHSLVAGQTGAGKSHTIRHLLRGAWRQGVPFLVIEPAKAEYRRLLDDPDIGPALRVFTLGDERVAPFRLNPFAAPPGVSVLTHIDLLRSVFGAAFAMVGPMPQLLEQCLHAVYRDHGWNVATGQNRRGIHPLSWPTLSDLYDVIDPIVAAMGYGPRIGPELQAALRVRVDSLRAGSKGLMLDTPVSVPMSELLARPTVLELEAIGDDDEKAFVMGVLWIFLYEHYRAATDAATDRLRHLTVVEEAHRLLTAAPMTTNVEIANPRGKAVETFGNILSEIRAYGEGIILAEQIPSRLDEGALKNTSLKIAHRLVAADERAIVGGAMNMDETQLRFLAALPRGRAAVFTEGDDRPALIDVAPGVGQWGLALRPFDGSEVELIGAAATTGTVGASDIDILADNDIEVLPDGGPPAIDWESDAAATAGGPAAPASGGELVIDLPPAAPKPVLTIDAAAPANQPLTPAERRLRDHMRAAFWDHPAVIARLPTRRYGDDELSALGRARALAAMPELRAAAARLVLSAAHEGFDLAAGVEGLRVLLGKHLAYDDAAATRPLAERLLGEWAVAQVGHAYGWPYEDVAQLQRLWAAAVAQTGDALLSAITIAGAAGLPDPYGQQYRRLARRSHDPFSLCGRVCPDGLCLYRYQMAALLGDEALDRAYHRGRAQAQRAPATAHAVWAAELRRTGRDAAHLILEDDVTNTARRRAAACFLVQKGDALPAARRIREREMKRGAAAALEEETP
jgi:hypothetical protein